MWAHILSITSIILGVYLLYVFFVEFEFDSTSQPTEYHMGCFSTDNHVNHSVSIRNYLKNINQSASTDFSSKKSFELTRQIKHKYNDLSRAIARDFEIYLHQYYQTQTKNIYQQNFRKSLANAQQKFKTCENSLIKTFNPDECNSDWRALNKSQQKYQDLKAILVQKIKRKEEQERKISYLILDNNFSQTDQRQKNFTNQIKQLNDELEKINAQKIQILGKKSPIEIFIATNKTKLQEDDKLFNECIKNQKIITFCNEVTNELNKITLTFTKHDIQTKIEKKKFIIESFKNAIKNAEKIGDKDMVRISQESLEKNEKELGLLMASIAGFQSFEQNYCSKCSDVKVSELKESIQRTRATIKNLTIEYNTLTDRQTRLGENSIRVSKEIDDIEESRQIYIASNMCITPECQEQRSRNIKDMGKVLNEMKKQVLDYKYLIGEHKMSHAKVIDDMDKWTAKLGEVVDCIHSRQYFYMLKDHSPKQSNELVEEKLGLKNRIFSKLQSFGRFDKKSRIVQI